MSKTALLLTQREKNSLRQMWQRPAHAQLWYGPEGSGKRLMAQYFVSGIICSDNEAPCEQCSNCTLVKAENHPDVLWLRKVEGSKDISIDQIRAVRAFAYLKPNMARHRVVIVENAELMNRLSANALLKTLEEPPANVIIVLLATSHWALLPTIRSRCQLFKVPAISLSELVQEFSSIIADRETLEYAHRVTGGKRAKINAVLEDMLESYSERIEAGMRFLEMSPADRLLYIERMIKDYKTTSSDIKSFEIASATKDFADALESILRDMAVVSSNHYLVKNSRQLNRLMTLAKDWSPQRAQRALSSLYELRYTMDKQVNPQLAWENFVLTTSI